MKGFSRFFHFLRKKRPFVAETAGTTLNPLRKRNIVGVALEAPKPVMTSYLRQFKGKNRRKRVYRRTKEETVKVLLSGYVQVKAKGDMSAGNLVTIEGGRRPVEYS